VGYKKRVPEHDINDLRMERQADGTIVVVCKCGWRTKAHKLAQHAVAEWQRHRDRY